MPDILSKKVEQLLRDGQSKKAIFNNLKNSEDPEDVAFLLNELPSLEKRQKFLLPHLLLTAILVIMTGMKLYAAIGIGRISLVFLLALVIPAINIYVLKKLLRFHRTGYQFLFIISIIALFHKENHHILEMGMLVTMIALSGFLYLKIFPVKEKITPPEKSDESK